MPVPLWFVLVAVLADGLAWALAAGIVWLAWALAVVLAVVLALIGWAVWVAWLSTREGG
jgi:hypothetical protein